MSVLELQAQVMRAAMAVACKRCGARVGRPCIRRTSTGREEYRETPHRRRIDTAFAKRTGRPAKAGRE